MFIEFPVAGVKLSAGDSMGFIESVKTVSELYTPVAGKVIMINSLLEDSSELVNEEPYDGGWIVEIEVQSSSTEVITKLLTAAQYKERVTD